MMKSNTSSLKWPGCVKRVIRPPDYAQSSPVDDMVPAGTAPRPEASVLCTVALGIVSNMSAVNEEEKCAVTGQTAQHLSTETDWCSPGDQERAEQDEQSMTLLAPTPPPRSQISSTEHASPGGEYPQVSSASSSHTDPASHMTLLTTGDDHKMKDAVSHKMATRPSDQCRVHASPCLASSVLSQAKEKKPFGILPPMESVASALLQAGNMPACLPLRFSLPDYSSEEVEGSRKQISRCQEHMPGADAECQQQSGPADREKQFSKDPSSSSMTMLSTDDRPLATLTRARPALPQCTVNTEVKYTASFINNEFVQTVSGEKFKKKPDTLAMIVIGPNPDGNRHILYKLPDHVNKNNHIVKCVDPETVQTATLLQKRGASDLLRVKCLLRADGEMVKSSKQLIRANLPWDFLILDLLKGILSCEKVPEKQNHVPDPQLTFLLHHLPPTEGRGPSQPSAAEAHGGRGPTDGWGPVGLVQLQPERCHSDADLHQSNFGSRLYQFNFCYEPAPQLEHILKQEAAIITMQCKAMMDQQNRGRQIWIKDSTNQPRLTVNSILLASADEPLFPATHLQAAIELCTSTNNANLFVTCDSQIAPLGRAKEPARLLEESVPGTNPDFDQGVRLYSVTACYTAGSTMSRPEVTAVELRSCDSSTVSQPAPPPAPQYHSLKEEVMRPPSCDYTNMTELQHYPEMKYVLKRQFYEGWCVLACSLQMATGQESWPGLVSRTN
ncbi:MAG: hypothetical protein GY813_04420, partial [Halieaceae bacterium]|nr:hypothetical protein [Halieaceae bacterium]